MAPRKGRAPAKNETAAGLINALKFVGVIKPPTSTSMPQHHHVWLNMGLAIAFDGVVAAGHPIEEGIAGYPHTKLLLEALENTDKNFVLTVRENGAFEIQSGKYQALVPSLNYDQVIPTQPDMNQAAFTDGEAFVKAMEAAGKIVSESGDIVLYSAVRLTGDGSVMATDGGTVVEAYHGNATPPGIILPKQFATALVKAGKAPVGMGMNHDWTTFTVHYADGSWLRTAIYPADTWPAEVTNGFFDLIGNHGQQMEIPPKLWSTVATLLPFTDENKRVIFRPGLVRTHADPRIGAKLDVAELPVTIDVDGKRVLMFETLAKHYAIGSYAGGATMVFYGDRVRGVIAGITPQAEPEPTQQPQGGGWGNDASMITTASGDGWAMAAPAERFDDPADKAKGWNGIPAGGLANDPEYESERQGIPMDEVPGPVEDAVIFSDTDLGIDIILTQELNGSFDSQKWLNSLRDPMDES
jgi:hypothetical protein